MRSISDELYKELNLGKEILTKKFSRSLMQEIQMYKTSDEIWAITPPGKAELFEAVKHAQETRAGTISISMKMSFVREQPPGSLVSSYETSAYVMSQPNVDKILEVLYNATDPDADCEVLSKMSFGLINFYDPVLYLSKRNKPTVIDVNNTFNDLIITKQCQMVGNERKDFWSVELNKTGHPNFEELGVTFVPINQKLLPSYLVNYTIIGLYTAFVFVIGQFLMSLIRSNSASTYISKMEKPDLLLLI